MPASVPPLQHSSRRELLDAAVRLYRRHFGAIVRRGALALVPLVLYLALSGGWLLLAVGTVA
ncbi:MAG: hypothetical protein H7Y32_03835, partial [Chloroflexales bacterium]|nr:hypothetical protein [Chloroflexales bacterium]